MKSIVRACGAASLGMGLWLAACVPIDVLLQPLTASCPNLNAVLIQSLADTLDRLEASGMSREDALDFATDFCIQNNLDPELDEDQLETGCMACANTVVLVVYDTF